MLDDLLEITDPARLSARLAEERAPDIVEALNDATPQRAAALLLSLPQDSAIDVLDQPGLEDPAEIIAALPVDRAVGIGEPHLDGVEPEANSSDLLQLQRSLRTDKPTFVPGSKFVKGGVHRRVTIDHLHRASSAD